MLYSILEKYAPFDIEGLHNLAVNSVGFNIRRNPQSNTVAAKENKIKLLLIQKGCLSVRMILELRKQRIYFPKEFYFAP